MFMYRSFLTKFLQLIYTKCKPMSEVGAEQMLLDTHSLQTILVEMILLGKEKQSSSSFMKIVHRGITKIDQLLKVVLRPHEPPEALVDTYLIVFTEHHSNQFQKILELKVSVILSRVSNEMKFIMSCKSLIKKLPKVPKPSVPM